MEHELMLETTPPLQNHSAVSKQVIIRESCQGKVGYLRQIYKVRGAIFIAVADAAMVSSMSVLQASISLLKKTCAKATLLGCNRAQGP